MYGGCGHGAPQEDAQDATRSSPPIHSPSATPKQDKLRPVVHNIIVVPTLVTPKKSVKERDPDL